MKLEYFDLMQRVRECERVMTQVGERCEMFPSIVTQAETAYLTLVNLRNMLREEMETDQRTKK